MTLLEQLPTVSGPQAVATVIPNYFLGCITTGYYLVRARCGRDIRDFESGSTGARNVGRLLGKTGFVLTVLGDFGKGALAVWATNRLTDNHLLAALALLAVTVGHIWPAQLRFAGGKGVATSLGALLIYDWRLAMTYPVFFIAGFLMSRRTTLPGLFAYVCLPAAAYWMHRDLLELCLIATLSGLILLAHRRNLAEEIPQLSSRRRLTKPKL